MSTWRPSAPPFRPLMRLGHREGKRQWMQ
jgi:hypothetical protein